MSLQEYIRSRGYNARSGHNDEKTSNGSKNEFHSGRRPLSTVVWLGTREDGTSRIVALLQLDRVGVLAPSCRDPTLMSLVAVCWGTQGQLDLSDKVVFEISNVLPLLEPYHMGRGEVDRRGRGEVDRRGLVFEVKAWTVRPARPPPLRLPPP